VHLDGAFLDKKRERAVSFSHPYARESSAQFFHPDLGLGSQSIEQAAAQHRRRMRRNRRWWQLEDRAERSAGLPYRAKP
jgi:hypothetical protein